MIEDFLKTALASIAKKTGHETPYILAIVPELERDQNNKERIVAIKAGNPPLVVISALYLQVTTQAKRDKSIPTLRDTLERILEYLPKMEHTLAVSPFAEVVSLKQGAKRWTRSNKLALDICLPDRYFDISYTVNITERTTKTSITRSGNELEPLILESKLQLSRIVYNQEELAEKVEDSIRVEEVKQLEVKPNSISIAITEKTETRIDVEY